MSAKSGVNHMGVQVVKLSETAGQFYEVDEEALASVLLRDDVRHLPVVVVSVAGAYRCGKSFLLNFFLRYLTASRSEQLNNEWMGKEDEILKGFEWRGGAESNTKGIHLWPEPIIVTIEETGERVAVLLMDTQGTFDTDNDMHNNSTIFALSTLLSSVQIYNLLANIGGDDLQHLQLFTKYGRLVSGEDKKVLQTLIFLVRDWMSPYEHAYGYNGGEELLNKKLQISHNQTKELQEVCQQIRTCFEKLQCFLMPHPGLAVANPNFKGHLRDITQDFKNSLSELVPSLFDPRNLTPKLINGNKIQAQGLFEFFKQYVKIFNSNDMPEVTTIVQATATASLMANLREAQQLYESMMKNNVKDDDSVTTSMLQHWHNDAVNAAIELYRHKKQLGSEEDAEKYLEYYKKESKALLQLFVWENDAKVRQRLTIARKSYEDIISAVCEVKMRLCLHPSDLQMLQQQALLRALFVFRQARSRVSQDQDDERNKLAEDLEQRYRSLSAVNEQNNKIAVLEAREGYISEMKAYMEESNVTSDALKTRHERLLREAVDYFHSQRNRPTENSEDPFLEHLKKDIAKFYEACQKMNFDQNKRAIQAAEFTYNKYILSAVGFQYACFHPKGLEALHEVAKEKALQEFLSHVAVDDQDQYKQQLLEKLKVRYEELKYINHLNNTLAVDRAITEYKEQMHRDVGQSSFSVYFKIMAKTLYSSLSNYHTNASAKALSIFNERRRGGTFEDDAYLDELKNKIQILYASYLEFYKTSYQEMSTAADFGLMALKIFM